MTAIAFLVGIANGYVLAQPSEANIDKLKNVIGPSPNSASLAKYSDWPVNLYTGVPGIDLPLLSVRGRTLSVPVSLSYHASGNRVADVASWVGLGWSLNVGGVISRSVRGLPDEDSYFSMVSNYTDPDDLTTIISTSVAEGRLVATAKNEIDSEQDIYNFSALGKSYRLMIMADGSVKTSPHSNLKFLTNPIRFPATSQYDWEVLMEDGTRLIFGGSGYVESTNNPQAKSAPYNSSWMIKSITSPSGETITYTYSSPASIEQDAYFSQTDNIKILETAGLPCDVLSESGSTLSKTSISVVSTLTLSSVESELERLDFITTSDREDLYGGVALSEIKLFSKITDHYTERYAFNTTYSIAATTTGYFGGTSNVSHLKKRLRLTSIEKKNVLEPSAQPMIWSFEYDPQNLPSRRSFAQDHWGYYNGDNAADGLVARVYYKLPDFTMFDSYRTTTGFMPDQHLLGGKREGNESSMKAEILTAIRYPTNGYSQFNYEPNSVQVTKETWRDTTVNLQMYLTWNTNPPNNYKTAEFTITKPSYIKLVLSSFISQPVYTERPNANVIVQINKPNGDNVFTKNADGTYWCNLITAGTYVFKVSTNVLVEDLTNSTYNINVDASLTYEESNGESTLNELTGGLRISSIIDYDGTTAYNSKYYQYEDPLVINPIETVRDYVTYQKSTASVNGGEQNVCTFETVFRNSSSKVIAGSIQGGTTGYGTVTVRYGPGGINGYSVSTFNSVGDEQVGDPYEIPYPPRINQDNRRGLLLSQKDYSATDVLLRQIDNTYSFTEISRITSFKAGYYETLHNCQNIYGNCGITQVYTPIVAEQTKHLTSTQTIWDQNGQNPQVTTTTNTYVAPNLQPVETTTTDSQGNLVKRVNNTALEMGTSDPVINSMVTRNMISQVVQAKTLKNGSLVSQSTTTYSDSWPNNMILPQRVDVKNGTADAYTTLTVDSYDDKANPKQITPVDGLKKVYIWDYQLSKPIAEVINVVAADCAYTGFESDGTGRWTVASDARYEIDAFTGDKSYPLDSGNLSLPGLTPGTSYLVSMWGRSASVSINGNAVSSVMTRNDWQLYQKVVTGVSAVTISGSGYIDDVRLHPSNAQMSTYTYGPFGVTSQTAPNLSTSFYEYDGLGRLVITRDKEKQILNKTTYNYKVR